MINLTYTVSDLVLWNFTEDEIMKIAEHIRSGWMCRWVDKRQSEALQNGKKEEKKLKVN